MKKNIFSKFVAVMIALSMIIGILPLNAFALPVTYEAHDDYYKVISKKDFELAPDIMESEIVLDNISGTQRQVAHVVEVDLNSEYTKVIPSYKGMVPTPGNYGVQIMSEQAKWAEENNYGNVVAAMNLSLSWYNDDYYNQRPELVGEPLGYMILDGVKYQNSRGQTSGAQTCVVINFNEKNGEPRPESMPKVEIRSTSDPITGWEEQVIPANFGFLVKDGVNQYGKDNNASNGASRSFVGIKADGTFVMVMNDGRQAPYSTGFTNYEMAEFMLSLGCVQAVNGDGGGSSAFLSQRPGEELKLNCKPSDGAERPTTHGILVISTAPSTGEFVRAHITTEHDFYAPGSTVKFDAIGTDLVGTAADIPADVDWKITDETMGTIENGTFVSNGKEGTVTAQMVYHDKVVGEASVEIVTPETFGFAQNVIVVPYGSTVNIRMKATINNGLNDVAVDADQIDLTIDNDELGKIDGLTFTATTVQDPLATMEGNLTAVLKGTELTAKTRLKIGAPSEVLFDFESDESLDQWKTGVVNGYHTDGFQANISYADKTNGKTHDGNGALRLETNGLSAVSVSADGYAQVPVYLKDGIVVKDALSIGFWAYIPDEYANCWIRLLYWYDSDGDGTYDKRNSVDVINQPEVYNSWDESGWKYFSADVSEYKSILIPGINDSDDVFPAANHPNKGTIKEPNDYRFIEFMFPHTNTNDLWKTYGTINGPYTIYIDSITADYSEAVEDREAPVFSSVVLSGNQDNETLLEKNSVVTTNSNILDVIARVAEDETKETATGVDASSAKAFVDGVEVDVSYQNGNMSMRNISVADGFHRVRFEISDNQGNKAAVVRLIHVQSGETASTVQLVPADPELDRLYGGSVYWMNLNATNIETIQSIETVIDLNSTNHWELDHMVTAEGFTSSYTVDQESNTATIVVQRTGNNTQSGNVTLASLPIRIIYYDTDIHIAGYTAETYWKNYYFWPYDLKVDVDKGVITYVDGYVSDVLNAFSNEAFSVDTEMYAVKNVMDQDYFKQHGTTHVHDVSQLPDVAATCTADGYTGRTYCEVCESVVDWGKTLEKTGHHFIFEDEILQCKDCKTLYNGEYTDGKFYVNGKVIADGWNGDYYYRDGSKLIGAHKIDDLFYHFTEDGVSEGPITGLFFDDDAQVYRYAISGEAKSGWYLIDDNWHYFRTGTLAAATGTKYYFSDFPYEFDETGRLLHVVWRPWKNSYRCYYGPTFYTGTAMGTWTVVEGKQYCFAPGGLVLTGYQTLRASFNAPYHLYEFDSKGVFIREVTDYTGFVNGFDGIRYYIDGVMQKNLQMIDGMYYFFSSDTGIAKTGEYVVTVENSNGLLTEDKTFHFDAATGAAEEKPEKGFVKKDGNTYYYIGNVLQKGLQLIDGKYYYFSVHTGIMRTGEYTVTVANSNGLLKKNRTFHFDLETGAAAEGPLNGIVTENGSKYYYINNEMQRGLQIIDGEFYYFSINTGIMRTGTYTVSVANSNGFLEKSMTFHFDKTTGAAQEKPRNGFVEESGNTYYYLNNILQKGLQIINGKYYYFSVNTGAMRTGKYIATVANANGLLTNNTTFFFDEKYGYAVGLHVINDKYYYFSTHSGECRTGAYTVTVANSNGMLIKNTTFHFDETTGASEETSMNGFVVEDHNRYYYSKYIPQTGLQLINGKYYYFSINSGIMRTGDYTVTVANSNGMLKKNTKFHFDEKNGYAVDENGAPINSL